MIFLYFYIVGVWPQCRTNTVSGVRDIKNTADFRNSIYLFWTVCEIAPQEVKCQGGWKPLLLFSRSLSAFLHWSSASAFFWFYAKSLSVKTLSNHTWAEASRAPDRRPVGNTLLISAPNWTCNAQSEMWEKDESCPEFKPDSHQPTSLPAF